MNRIFVFCCSLAMAAFTAHAEQSTAFRYNGLLKKNSVPLNEAAHVRFTLWDASNGGNQVGPAILSRVDVLNGVFSTTIDFGRPAYNGDPRWLQLAVSNVLGFETMVPRQAVESVPYATRALEAEVTRRVQGALTSENLAGSYHQAVILDNPSNQFRGILSGDGSTISNVHALTLDGMDSEAFWKRGGNTGEGGNVIGLLDGASLDLVVGGLRALRLQMAGTNAPNILGGSSGNFVWAGASGTTVFGGSSNYPHRVHNHHYGVIAGGDGNTLSSPAGVIGGGVFNTITNPPIVNFGVRDGISVIAGGYANTIDQASYAGIVGGESNLLRKDANHSVIAGGRQNHIGSNSHGAVIGGGTQNVIRDSALNAAVGGGFLNDIGTNATLAVIPGGFRNIANGQFSLAAGYRAAALHSSAFVWSDSSDQVRFSSTGEDQFLIRASGGVGIGTNDPQSQLHVRGTVTADGFVGNGAGLTNISAGNLADVGRLSLNQTFTASNVFTGVLTATNGSNRLGGSFNGVVSGDGGGLTNLQMAGDVMGPHNQSFVTALRRVPISITPPSLGQALHFNGTHWHPSDPPNISGAAYLSSSQTFTASNTFSGVMTGTNVNNRLGGNFDGVVGGNGAGLTNLNFANTPVPWANLTGIPSGFVDGVDNNTIYTAGVGLNLSGNQFNVSFGGSGAASTAARSDHSHDASGIVAGTLNDARLSANVALLNRNPQTFSGVNSFTSGGMFSAPAGSEALRVTGSRSGGLASQVAHIQNTDTSINAAPALRILNTSGQSVDGALNVGNTGTGKIISFRGASGEVANMDTNGNLSFGSVTRQMLNLWGLDYGLGVQDQTFYSRSDVGFAWFHKGSHTNTPNHPGENGAVLMTLDGSGNLAVGGPSIGSTGSALELRVNNQRGLRLESVSGTVNVIGGHVENASVPGAFASTIAGGGVAGFGNRVGSSATIGGGQGNLSSGTASVIGGGARNTNSGINGTIAGGAANRVTALGGAIGGGANNVASGSFSTVAGGGGYNSAYSNYGTNFATGDYSAIGGGDFNSASGAAATVAGGEYNHAGGTYATVAGGFGNQANGATASIAGGGGNSASGNWSAIPGGALNVASGQYTLAAGRNAKAVHDGAFVWADSRPVNFSSSNTNQFSVRATGGAVVVTEMDAVGNILAGVQLAPGSGAWSSMSDRNSKTNLSFVDTVDVLQRLVSIPIQSWNYKSQPDSVRHIGPMAQDFAAAFGVGDDDKHITTVDADGVALAAIQGLNQKLEEKLRERDEQIRELKRLVEALAKKVDQNTAR